MKFSGGLRFEGEAPFQWAQRQKDGSILLVFDREHGETSLEFDSSAWGAVMDAVLRLDAGEGELTERGETVHGPVRDELDQGPGMAEIRFAMLDAEKGRIEWKLDYETGLDDGMPTIIMKPLGQEGDGDLELNLSLRAARSLHDLLTKVLAAHSLGRKHEKALAALCGFRS